MKKQEVTISMDVDFKKLKQQSVQVTVKNSRELAKAAKSYLESRLCDTIKLFNETPLQVTLEEGDIEVPHKVAYNLSFCMVDLTGFVVKHLLFGKQIECGSELHNKLVSLSLEDSLRSRTAFKTFRALGFADGEGITRKGKEELKRLATQGPEKGIKGDILIAKGLYKGFRHSTQGIYQYLTNRFRYTIINKPSTVAEGPLTERAKEWLIEKAPKLVKRKELQGALSMLIQYLPAEQLNEYLVHEDAAVRKIAQMTYASLEETSKKVGVLNQSCI